MSGERSVPASSEHRFATPSRAAVLGHPIHPALIPFPIAFLVGAFVTDIVATTSDSDLWPSASLWLTAGGVATGVLAAAVGLVDFLAIARARRRIGWIHFVGNAVALVLAAVSWAIRVGDPVDAVVPTGIVLSGAVAAILGVTGWAGGELSYRHGIGVDLGTDRGE